MKDCEISLRKDPMSHRIIEKRRRDRMNNCLADLSRLVPTNYLKKGRGRIEKTEIIEMAIKHLKHLQAHPCKDPANCEVAKTTEQDHKRQYRLGYHECMSETVRFMVESEGLFSGDGVCVRLINHLQKHYDKVAGGLCYTQALGMMISDETKPQVAMEVDSRSNSCFPLDNCSNGAVAPENNHVSTFPYESKPDVPDLKQEIENNSHHSQPPPPSITPVKVTSQLREMLQNPGVPKDPSRNNSNSSNNGSISNRTVSNGNNSPPSPVPMPVLVVVPPSSQNETPKTEESCYKFKNNIKHRFNADLRHHTSSPTDSHHSDKMSLPDEDHNNNKIHMVEPYPLRSGHPPPGHEDRLVHNGLCSTNSHTGHAFSPYPPSHPPPDHAVKIPERVNHSEGVGLPSSYNSQHWDSHAETASSCGSSSSPPPPHAVRSNGSSSGYSTNGENNSCPTMLKSSNGHHSPTLSPYPHTPDRLSNRSPSPLQGQGMPIFALHPKGTFYIPLTVDASLLLPCMAGLDELAPVLHPISICVNLSCHSLKVEKLNGSSASLQYRSHSSYLMDKFHDRYVYPEKPLFYPCPTSPTRNGCT
ncbi:transcription factor cwo-like isoform X2 [Argiope bruennichi]|uniref:Transcription factor cwo like protein n=1 Tax=Argiope bruennichi TaxID=94029 RepID=A0A8T0FVD1_ARGBR|nr:transcription factor cwo-like isoform X2 [Argiope bruennichi]KAF8794706.1 Transcription factor cwo like protein [Argiope bruennichi]